MPASPRLFPFIGLEPGSESDLARITESERRWGVGRVLGVSAGGRMGRIPGCVSLAVALVLLCAAHMIAQEPPLDPFRLPTVQAACGAEGVSASAVAKRPPAATPALEPGKARIYVITETYGLLGSRGAPVLLGIDGRWFGASRVYHFDYSFVDVDPGLHHLCVASTVKGVLPHTSAAISLARVDAVAGKTYYFFKGFLNPLAPRTFTLQPISADAGAMYLQSLPSAKLPEVWKTPAAQAACGLDPNHVPDDPQSTPSLPGPPAPGKALVYFFSGMVRFGSHGEPVRIGMDARWVGETHTGSFVALNVAPGIHHLCSSEAVGIGGGKPVLWLGELHAVAGQTYFVDTETLEPADDNLATYLLKRIAAMPKTDTPDAKALAKWIQANLPYSQSELRACGIPASGTDSVPSVSAPPAGDSTGTTAKAYFLLASDTKMLRQRNAVNVGLDGRWVASLRNSSWVSLALAPGKHRVCIHLESEPPGWTSPQIAPTSSLYLDSVNAVDGATTYFESRLANYGDFTFFFSTRLDPDEGAMLIALYPQAGTAHP